MVELQGKRFPDAASLLRMNIKDLHPMKAWRQLFAGLLGRLSKHDPPQQPAEEHEIIKRLRELMELERTPFGSQPGPDATPE